MHPKINLYKKVEPYRRGEVREQPFVFRHFALFFRYRSISIAIDEHHISILAPFSEVPTKVLTLNNCFKVLEVVGSVIVLFILDEYTKGKARK